VAVALHGGGGAPEALVESARMGVWAGLVGALRHDGGGSLAGLETRRVRRTAQTLDAVSRAVSFLNAAWTPLFFGLHRPGVAFAGIILLWLAIAATLVVAGRVSRPAAWLLSPYLVWVSFAAVLNGTLWWLNA